MKKLIDQILKFGIVGVIAFFVDFGVYTACNFAGVPYLLSGFLGFTISVIVNYLLSMKYVFVRRDDLSRTKEFTIFVILSAFGLLINELVLYICLGLIYPHWSWLRQTFGVHTVETLAKLGATGIVMIYNFISRKVFLEKHE